MSKRKPLYHCSLNDHGPELRAQRAVPMYSADDEPDTPRLCVCPSIPQCFTARLFFGGPVFVYSIIAKGVAPRNVWDSFITGERWILPGVILKKEFEIPQVRVDAVLETVANWHLREKREADIRTRAATLARACIELTEYCPNGLEEFSLQACEEFGIDPLTYFD